MAERDLTLVEQTTALLNSLRLPYDTSDLSIARAAVYRLVRGRNPTEVEINVQEILGSPYPEPTGFAKITPETDGAHDVVGFRNTGFRCVCFRDIAWQSSGTAAEILREPSTLNGAGTIYLEGEDSAKSPREWTRVHVKLLREMSCMNWWRPSGCEIEKLILVTKVLRLAIY